MGAQLDAQRERAACRSAVASLPASSWSSVPSFMVFIGDCRLGLSGDVALVPDAGPPARAACMKRPDPQKLEPDPRWETTD